MPSQFDANFAAMNDDFFSVYGEPVVMSLSEGGTRNVVMVILREQRAPTEIETAGNLYNEMPAYISSVDDVSGRINPVEVKKTRVATPDKFAIDGQSWKLQRILERNVGGMHFLKLVDGADGV